MEDVQVKQTSDYNQFKLLEANRDLGKGHIERLKKVFEERGNLTRVQPILVNENMEIIDGQHRFVAAKELGQPIYYTSYSGLGVSDARSMNIMHKRWHPEDYAKSYAGSGDASYRRYLELRQEFEDIPHSTIVLYTTGADLRGIYSQFRNGEYTLTPENKEIAKERLGKLSELKELVPNARNTGAFATAILKILKNDEYDHERMVTKLIQVGDSIPSFASVSDFLRSLETIYNRDRPSESHTRLF